MMEAEDRNKPASLMRVTVKENATNFIIWSDEK